MPVSQDLWNGVTFKDLVEGEVDGVPTVPEPQALGEATRQDSGSAIILVGSFAAPTLGPDAGHSKWDHPPPLLFRHQHCLQHGQQAPQPVPLVTIGGRERSQSLEGRVRLGV